MENCMDHSSLVTIIVPVYNVELYLRECIDSLLTQTYKDLEIILVNDGSPDNCPSICEEYARLDKRVKTIHKENGGLSDARNVGLQNATGQYISFVDSDDVVHPKFIETLYIDLHKEPDLSLSMVYYRPFYETTEINHLKVDMLQAEIWDSGRMYDDFYSLAISPFNIVAWNKLYKKEVWKTLRFPVGKLHEDEWIAHYLYDYPTKISVNTSKLYFYRQRENSIMTVFKEKKFHDVVEAFNDRLIFAKQRELKGFYQATVEQKDLAITMMYFKYSEKILKNYIGKNFSRIIGNSHFKLKVKLILRFLQLQLCDFLR